MAHQQTAVSRRHFLQGMGLALAGGLLSSRAAPAAGRPNILFIFSDDHSLQTIGAYNWRLSAFCREHHLTPNIDRLAREGGLFEQSFCCNSICGPSRAAILTGKHSHINGFTTNERQAFNGAQWTFPKALRGAGYQTALIGKWHLVSDPTGFDHWEVLPGQGNYYNPDFLRPGGKVHYEGYVTDLITDHTLQWLEGRKQDQPFLLMCQHKAPHRSWMPPERYLALLEDATVPEPSNLFDDYRGRASPAAEQKMEIGRHMNADSDLKLTPPLATTPPAELKGEYRRMTPAQRQAWDAAYVPSNEAFRKARPQGRDLVRWQYQRYLKDYLRCIKAVDDSVGRVLQYLDEHGLAENTIVIYCADQGFYMGEHGWYDKRWMYEESFRMPFIIRWPGVVKPGSRFTPMIQNIDYAPTFLAMAGLPAPDGVQGRSFLPILKGETPADWRDSLYYHYYEYPMPHGVRPHRGVRTKRYTLVHYYTVGEWELFDLEKDPNQMKSVYADPAQAGVVAELKAELERLARHYQVPPLPPPEPGARPPR